ncbi:MAG: hypothetical protein M1837_003708 [Sclerophora amabilis]|nr:MAG: hypothetical protein M1837_003708 [Sclerophora amabilis]
MAGYADTIRGDGLERAHDALARLEADPLGLDRARMRFSQPPPSYRSQPSGTTTLSASPEPTSDEKRRRELRDLRFYRRKKIMDERAASFPLQQFKDQREEETKRIFYADPRSSWMGQIPIQGIEETQAVETVKKQWIEQGIWKDKWEWDEMADGRFWDVGPWKHEEPLELESESETDTEAESPPPTFSISGTPQKSLQPKPRRPKSDHEKRRIAERRVKRETERQASRPYHQFIYQIGKERERIQDKSANGEGADAADINTRAYENVKNTWTTRGMWNERWGLLPGMSWKHEEPLEEEETDEDPASISTKPSVNGSHVAEQAPLRRLFGSPSPVGSNQLQASSITSTSQQGLSADIDFAAIENGDAVRSPSPSNSPRPGTGKRVLRPTPGQTSRSSKRKPSDKDEQIQPVASKLLDPVHPSRVSKATEKKRPGPGPTPRRRPNASQDASSSDALSLSAPDNADLLPQTPSVLLHQNKRTQPPEPTITKDWAVTASVNSVKSAAGSRPKRQVAGNLKSKGSAKPQGISKRRRSNTTRGKARKDRN